jgi:methylmalonyl-CoA mutase C-terminal domain/subunit
MPTGPGGRGSGGGAGGCIGHLRSIPGVRRRYRVVVAKPGLDGHDRGAKVIARALRDRGFEVIYTGLHQTPEQIAETVVQEDADAVGLSVLSGAHMTLFPRVMAALHQRAEGEEVLVFGGGIIPAPDVARLKEVGVAEIFGPGATMVSICEWLETTLDQRDEHEEHAHGSV